MKQVGLAFAGLSLTPVETYALPLLRHLAHDTGDNVIRLRSNENAYGPSPTVRKAMKEAVNSTNRYDWDLTKELMGAVAVLNNVTPEHILMGAGSTDIIDAVVRLAARKSGNFVIATPTYNYWCDSAAVLGMSRKEVPVTAGKQHDLGAMQLAINNDTRLVYICNPDNPAGTVCARGALELFIELATRQAIVLVDEAYLEYSGEASLRNLVSNNKNLVIAKTFSKIYGLAGARVGYAIAHPDTVGKLEALQGSPDAAVSVVSAAGALAAIRDKSFVAESYELNKKVRNYATNELQRLGIPCIPSHTNFLYFSLADYKPDFFARLKDNNIMGTKIYEDAGKWSRITVGTMKEMEAFIKAIG